MSTQPSVSAVDQPPALRFQATAIPDTIASEETGRPEYMDVIKVFIRAAGDMKCEVPDIAKKTAYRTYSKEIMVKKKITKWIEEDGKTKQIEQEAEVPETKEFHEAYTAYPWLDKLEQRLKHGAISQNYFDYCKKAFEGFIKNMDMPIDGTPVADWVGIHESQKKKLIEMSLNSVEKVAEMTDGAIESFGIGGRDLKNKAIAFLQKQKNVDVEKEEMKSQITALEQKLNDILSQSKGSDGAKEVEALRAKYEEMSGKKPHHLWGVPRLTQEIKKLEEVAA